jgi:hypothetical protein
MRKFVYRACAVSFTYGLYRGWTLPIWEPGLSDLGPRIAGTACVGVMYGVPIISFYSHMKLCMRLHDRFVQGVSEGFGDHWSELGFHHPNLI